MRGQKLRLAPPRSVFRQPSEPQSSKTRGRSASRKRSLTGRSPSWKTNRQPYKKNFLEGICTELLCDNWHPSECQFYKSESECKFGTECPFPHWKVEEQLNKRPKKGGEKSAVAMVKDVRQLGCVSQDFRAAGICSDFTEGYTSFGPIRRVRFTRAALRHANIREKKFHR